MSDTPNLQAIESDAPRQNFSRCHVGFLTLLEASFGLPEMIAR